MTQKNFSYTPIFRAHFWDEKTSAELPDVYVRRWADRGVTQMTYIYVVGTERVNAINHSFNKDSPSLSPLLRMGIITLIPKGDKERSLINNWRPISLLSVIYKLLSGTIANRFIKALPHIIHSSQKAYLPNRFIGGVILSLIHIWRCRRIERCRSRWSPYH